MCMKPIGVLSNFMSLVKQLAACSLSWLPECSVPHQAGSWCSDSLHCAHSSQGASCAKKCGCAAAAS